MAKSLLSRWFAALTESEINELELLILERNAKVIDLPKKEWPQFDFNLIYHHFPRKVGKATGINKLKRSIKLQRDYDLLLEATKNYAQLTKKECSELKFIMHFSTFASRWQDYTNEALNKAQVSLNIVPDFSSVLS